MKVRTLETQPYRESAYLHFNRPCCAWCQTPFTPKTETLDHPWSEMEITFCRECAIEWSQNYDVTLVVWDLDNDDI